MKKLTQQLLALTVGLTSVGANAELIAYDWKAAGDTSIVLDTNTGNQWLKFTETLGKSVNQVIQLTSTGQDLAGWRIASKNEVSALIQGNMTETFGENNDGPSYSAGYIDGEVGFSNARSEAKTFNHYFSANSVAPAANHQQTMSVGYFKYWENDTKYVFAGVMDVDYITEAEPAYKDNVQAFSVAGFAPDNNYSYRDYGIWMIENTSVSDDNTQNLGVSAGQYVDDVSAPASLGVLLLAGLALVRRKKA